MNEFKEHTAPGFEYRKPYWLREEIPIADELMSYAPKLLHEFLRYHSDFVVGNASKLTPYVSQLYDPLTVRKKLDAWLTQAVKYTKEDSNIFQNNTDTELFQKHFPTAVSLVKKFGDDCPIALYSVLNKQSVIERHTGFENKEAKYIRIHIPLFVPPGDIFFECEGLEIDWSDIWAFDNQLIHSAHNYTNNRRLAFIIDLSRESLGLEPGKPWDEKRQAEWPAFERGKYPRLLHTKQK